MADTPVNSVIENLDIRSAIKEHILSQFSGKVNLDKFLNIIADELQELESSAIIPLLDGRTLRDATGQLLDNVGQVLGVERQGLPDAPYRSILYMKLFKRNNRGTYKDILDLLRYSFGDEQAIVQKGSGYDLDIAVTFCLGDDTTFVEDAPVFGFESDTGTLGYSDVSNLDEGQMAALQFSDNSYINTILFESIIDALPVLTAVKIIQKGSSLFGFQGNPYAVGYGVEGLPDGGQLSLERYTNRG